MNIVTIDFDIVMHRSIGLYNDLVDDDNTIQTILDDNKESHFIPNPDLFLYNYLTNYILNCTKKLSKDKIIFIEEHHEVLNAFNTGLIKNNENFNIFNIDFHHDIAYNDEDIDSKIEELDCGNWVKYLFEHYPQNFNQYIWINTDESGDANNDNFGMSINRKVFTHNIKKYNLEALVKSTDILFICRSIPWVPREEQQLYETWKDLIDFLYKK